MKDCTVTIGWTWEPDDQDTAYDFRITGTCSPGEPTVMYDRDGGGYPGSPPVAEVIGVELARVHVGDFSWPASEEPHAALIVERFKAEMEGSKELRDQIETALFEAASEANDPAARADEEYDRRKNEGM